MSTSRVQYVCHLEPWRRNAFGSSEIFVHAIQEGGPKEDDKKGNGKKREQMERKGNKGGEKGGERKGRWRNE